MFQKTTKTVFVLILLALPMWASAGGIMKGGSFAKEKAIFNGIIIAALPIAFGGIVSLFAKKESKKPFWIAMLSGYAVVGLAVMYSIQ